MDHEWMHYIHEQVEITAQKTKQKTHELAVSSKNRFEEFMVIKSKLALAELRFWQMKYQASMQGKHWVYWDVLEYMSHSKWSRDQQITFLIAFQDLMIPEFEHLIIQNCDGDHTKLKHLTREAALQLLQEQTPIKALSYVIALKHPRELRPQKKSQK